MAGPTSESSAVSPTPKSPTFFSRLLRKRSSSKLSLRAQQTAQASTPSLLSSGASPTPPPPVPSPRRTSPYPTTTHGAKIFESPRTPPRVGTPVRDDLQSSHHRDVRWSSQHGDVKGRTPPASATSPYVPPPPKGSPVSVPATPLRIPLPIVPAASLGLPRDIATMVGARAATSPSSKGAPVVATDDSARSLQAGPALRPHHKSSARHSAGVHPSQRFSMPKQEARTKERLQGSAQQATEMGIIRIHCRMTPPVSPISPLSASQQSQRQSPSEYLSSPVPSPSLSAGSQRQSPVVPAKEEVGTIVIGYATPVRSLPEDGLSQHPILLSQRLSPAPSPSPPREEQFGELTIMLDLRSLGCPDATTPSCAEEAAAEPEPIQSIDEFFDAWEDALKGFDNGYMIEAAMAFGHRLKGPMDETVSSIVEVNAGLVFAKIGLMSLAKTHFEAAALKDHLCGLPVYLLAVTAYYNGDFEYAHKLFNECLTTMPGEEEVACFVDLGLDFCFDHQVVSHNAQLAWHEARMVTLGQSRRKPRELELGYPKYLFRPIDCVEEGETCPRCAAKLAVLEQREQPQETHSSDDASDKSCGVADEGCEQLRDESSSSDGDDEDHDAAEEEREGRPTIPRTSSSWSLPDVPRVLAQRSPRASGYAFVAPRLETIPEEI